MILLPAIDLKDGRCVRLYRGSFDTVHTVSDSALETAKAFYAAGARYVHMVDLDGAKSGERINSGIVAGVAAASGLKVELGGGLRTMSDLDAADRMGVTRMVIGSAAVSHPEFVAEAVRKYGDRIAVGIDTENGHVKTAGWVDDSGLDYLEFAKRMEALSVKTIIFTDIATDGMLSGPSYDRLAALQGAVSCRIIASGGVSCNADLSKLNRMGIYGAIIGKAYYTGGVDLKAAVEESGAQ